MAASSRRLSQAVRFSTAQKWQEEADFKTWLKIEASNGYLSKMWCSACKEHDSRIGGCRNFSRAFIDGVVEPGALKRDNANKHRKSEQHQRAVNMRADPFTRAALYKETAIGRGMEKAESEERGRVGKLVDIAYMMAKEEIPFTKFASIARLEIRHKVALGQTYLTELKCKEITEIIGMVMETEFLSRLQKSHYISVLSDGRARH